MISDRSDHRVIPRSSEEQRLCKILGGRGGGGAIKVRIWEMWKWLIWVNIVGSCCVRLHVANL